MQQTGSRSIGHRPSAASSARRTSRTRLNTVLAWTLLLVVTLSPIPLGSVQPIFWGISAAVIGILAMIYIASIGWLGVDLRISLRSLRLGFVLFIAYCAYLVIQVLPLGPLLGGFSVTSLAGDIFTADTISISRNMTMLMLMRHLGYGVFFFLCLQAMANDSRRMQILDGLTIVIVGYAVLAMISLQAGDTILGIKKWAYQGSATGTFVNRNSFATFLAMGACVASAQITGMIRSGYGKTGAPGSTPRLLLYVVALVIIIFVSFATASRMGAFAALAGSVIPFVVLAVGTRSWRVSVVVLLALVVALTAGMVFYGNLLFERLQNTDQDAVGRIEVYKQVLDLALQRPWLGMGGGSFELAFPLVHQAPVSPDLYWDRAHNTYLSLWAELGLVVGSFPALAIVAVAITIVRRLARGVGSAIFVPATAAIATICAAGLHSLVDFSLEIQANAYLFLFIVAAGAAGALQQGASRQRAE